MDHRHIGDYELDLLLEDEQARSDLNEAQRFVQRIEQWLKQEGWL